MCGYARRHVSTRQLRELADLLSSPTLLLNQGVECLAHFYPAFGGVASKQLNDLVIESSNGLSTVDATWWFDCSEEGNGLVVNNKRTTFNARNLSSPYWRSAIRHSRGVFVATGIGEGKMANGKNRHYLVESDTPILLGCVYRAYPNGSYSTAIITRDKHLRFEKYHDKAFPLMLPHDSEFLKLWLSDTPESHPTIADLLERPQIFNNLKITWVKTFKHAQPLADPQYLAADA